MSGGSKMGNKLLGKDLEPKCEYCVYGRPTPDGQNILCVYCGVPSPDYHCKKYKYDPLKREPQKPARLGEFSEDEFKL